MRRTRIEQIDADLCEIQRRRRLTLGLVRRCHDELIDGYRNEDRLLKERHELTSNSAAAGSMRPMIHR